MAVACARQGAAAALLAAGAAVTGGTRSDSDNKEKKERLYELAQCSHSPTPMVTLLLEAGKHCSCCAVGAAPAGFGMCAAHGGLPRLVLAVRGGCPATPLPGCSAA